MIRSYGLGVKGYVLGVMSLEFGLEFLAFVVIRCHLVLFTFHF